jgi:pyrimidine-nucleoside phosphorylase
MRAVDLIVKKRNGGEHSAEEIRFLVDGYVSGDIPDYQVSAWLMAVYYSGMSGAEAGELTRAMIDSGETIDLSGLAGPLVDKHSTGGVGDKVSLILAPVAAACGLQVPMMSGRALGHTGGTLDKLESITGYSTQIPDDRFREVIAECGYAMIGQSERIVPADRLLYALRDVTGTVESVPLITASIMSKKFAEGARALVFDVKTGNGAFMKTLSDSRQLAESLIATGKNLGRGVIAVITRMDEPLGRMVGNFLEVVESVRCLQGSAEESSFSYPGDLMSVTLRLAAWMLIAGGLASTIDEAQAKCQEVIDDGSAYERFRRNVALQGGDSDQLERELNSRRASNTRTVSSAAEGWVASVDAFAVGMVGVNLGVGRSRAEDDVLADVGIELHKKAGDRVSRGDELCTIYAETPEAADAAVSGMENAYTFSDRAVQVAPPVVQELSSL